MSTSSCIMCNKKNPNCCYGQFWQIIFYFHLKRWQFNGRRNYSWEGDDTNMKVQRDCGPTPCSPQSPTGPFNSHIRFLVRIFEHKISRLRYVCMFSKFWNGYKKNSSQLFVYTSDVNSLRSHLHIQHTAKCFNSNRL